MTMKFRVEQDSFGDLLIPISALYGAQTQRAVQNFAISGQQMPVEFIKALALIKAAAANANGALGQLSKTQAKAIESAALEIVNGSYSDQFPVDVYQTGSGTSSNMNVNEVIAHLANRKLKSAVNPNNHVNLGQSSNDVVPSANLLASSLVLQNQLMPALQGLQTTITRKAKQLKRHIKTGRTHLMDAMPISMEQELLAWSAQLSSAQARFIDCSKRLHELPLGGTAVGTGVNANPKMTVLACRYISKYTRITVKPAGNKFESIAAQDHLVELSGHCNTLAVCLMKICNDLRWMNSGPLTGLSEIALPALQPGSSIMPGKVNPVIPEAVAMVCAQVMGNHTSITIAGQSGNFQLNTMMPLIANNSLQSLNLLASACQHLGEKAIAGFIVNSQTLTHALTRNPMLVTALNPIIGYSKATLIAKRAYAENRPIIELAEEMTDLSLAELKILLDPTRLTR